MEGTISRGGLIYGIHGEGPSLRIFRYLGPGTIARRFPRESGEETLFEAKVCRDPHLEIHTRGKDSHPRE